jgi:hypothetical protein
MNWKKVVGLIVMGLIVSVILFVIYRIIIREPEVVSPLPKEEGVRVIYISPEPKKK